MNTKLQIPIAALIMISSSYAHAYLTQVENATAATIKVTINLAKCKPLNIGEIKPGKKSKLFDTGACCFESIHAIATDGPLKGIESGTVTPWGKGWLCFQNVLFKCTQATANGQTTHLDISHSPLKK